MRFSLSGFDAQLSANGQQVFVVEAEAVNAYDIDSGEYLYPVLEAASDYMTDITVSPNGKLLSINKHLSKGIQIVHLGNDPVKGNLPAVVDNHPVFSQDGRYMAVKNGRPAADEIRFWELGSGNELTHWQGLVPRDGYVDISFNSDFTRLATANTDGYYQSVYVWEIPKFSLLATLTQLSNGDRRIDNLKFISDDRLLFARGIDPDAFLFWDLRTGDLLYEIPAEIHGSERGNPAVFSPDGRLLLVLDNDGTIHVWGVRCLEETGEITFRGGKLK